MFNYTFLKHYFQWRKAILAGRVEESFDRIKRLYELDTYIGFTEEQGEWFSGMIRKHNAAVYEKIHQLEKLGEPIVEKSYYDESELGEQAGWYVDDVRSRLTPDEEYENERCIAEYKKLLLGNLQIIRDSKPRVPLRNTIDNMKFSSKANWPDDAKKEYVLDDVVVESDYDSNGDCDDLP